jgi:GGDEF domain-containing protein
MGITAGRAVTDRATFLADLDDLLRRGSAPLALALTDLDGFAAVNGSYGRAAGDAVLAGWDRVLAANVPEGGIAASPLHGNTAGDLWRAAGEALMRAKRDGRDRVALHVEEKMVLKSNYYSKANLERLAKLSSATDRTEASLLREALDDLLYKHRDAL